MKVVQYQQGDCYIAILPEIPKWFVIDEFASQILTDIINELPIQDILAKYEDGHEEIIEVHKTLLDIISEAMAFEEQVVKNVLTTVTTVAMISVTRKCQLRCAHCYVDAHGQFENELTLAEHKRLAPEIKSVLCPEPDKEYRVALTGGEPFCHPEIIEIIRAYKESGVGVGMSTNGLLIGEREADALLDMQVSISISLDGASAPTHERIRGAGTFAQTVEKIGMLTSKGVRVGINTLVHQGNFSELEAIINLADQLGCAGVNPIDLVQLGRACKSRLKRAPEAEIFSLLGQHLTDHPEHIRLFAKNSMFCSLGSALLAGIYCASCGVGSRPCVYIDSDGSIYPCANTQRERFCLGNIRTQTLDVCASKDHPILKELCALDVETLNSKCSVCDVRRFCGGDCRGETENVTGDLRAPYVNCDDRFESLLRLMVIAGQHPEFFEDRVREYLVNAHL